MKKFQRKIKAALWALLLASGSAACSDNNTMTDVQEEPPTVSFLAVTPAQVDLDTVRFEANNQASVRFRVEVTIQFKNTAIRNVRAAFVAQTDPEPLASAELLPRAGSTTSAQYAGDLNVRLTRTTVGHFTVVVTPFDVFGQSGGDARQTIRITDSRASAPTLLSVESPDTVRIPESGTRLIQITARATHPNGVNFIREVRATRTDNRAITFQLLDDGERNGLSGDQTAGDGIFTATLQVPSTNTPATRTFEYQAIDRAERLSNIISKSIIFTR
ncbi:MAG: hypothetical protein CMR00_10250 [[Chlorobium] sp. 445]|nr:MAG: hypothetical protein CMR00_10250 [[Chlorobium] sp. 445]